MGNDLEPQRFFFIHVMKTGGTSFVLHMLSNFAPEQMYPSTIDRRHADDVEPYASIADVLGLAPERRAEICFYSGHFPAMVSGLLGVDVVTLTLVRDPVERTVSVLKHFKRLYDRYREMPIDAIYDDEVVFRHFVENFQTRVFALTPQDRPLAFSSAVSYHDIRATLEDPPRGAGPRAGDVITIDDRRLALAKERLAAVDVVGLSERFPEFVAEIRRRFGWWPAGLDLGGRANVSTENWDVRPSLRDRIATDNAFDIELYSYASELVAKRPE